MDRPSLPKIARIAPPDIVVARARLPGGEAVANGHGRAAGLARRPRRVGAPPTPTLTPEETPA